MAFFILLVFQKSAGMAAPSFVQLPESSVEALTLTWTPVDARGSKLFRPEAGEILPAAASLVKAFTMWEEGP